MAPGTNGGCGNKDIDGAVLFLLLLGEPWPLLLCGTAVGGTDACPVACPVAIGTVPGILLDVASVDESVDDCAVAVNNGAPPCGTVGLECLESGRFSATSPLRSVLLLLLMLLLFLFCEISGWVADSTSSFVSLLTSVGVSMLSTFSVSTSSIL